MKFLYSFLILMILPHAYAQDSSGCLVTIKKKLVVDSKCVCLKSNSCTTIKKFEMSEKFFNAKGEGKKPIFNEQEKKAYAKSYTLFNQIMELKAKGMGNSPEIKKAYFELDKLNSEISILLHKNHGGFMAKATRNYEEKARGRREKEAKLIKRAEALVGGATPPPLASSPKSSTLEKAPTPIIEANAPIKAEAVSNSAPAVVETKKPGELTNEEKENILRNLKKGSYDVNENDSLFDIISKTYKGKAYKQLLAPTGTPDTTPAE